MIHRLFTGKSQAYTQAIEAIDKRLKVLDAAVSMEKALRDRITRLEIAQSELQALHDALGDRLQKLTGTVYGRKGGRGNVADTNARELDAIPAGDKDALRARVGLRAGVRFQHNDEG